MTTLPDGIIVENWTMHRITFRDDALGIAEIIEPEAAGPAHVQMYYEIVDGSKYILKSTACQSVRLPDPRTDERTGEKVRLIVSAVVKNTYQDRNDLILPTKNIRDDSGRVIACQAFIV